MSFITVMSVAVADRHAGRLLAAVLQGVEPVEGQVCDGSPRGVDPEDSARFLRLHHRLVTARTGGRRARPSRDPESPGRDRHRGLRPMRNVAPRTDVPSRPGPSDGPGRPVALPVTMIDLHTHSTVSDGSDPPERIAGAGGGGRLQRRGPHRPRLAGRSRPAPRAGRGARGRRSSRGARSPVVPVGPGGMHVLVYFVEDDEGPLGRRAGPAPARTGDERNLALADRLAELGIPVTYPMAGGAGRRRGGIGPAPLRRGHGRSRSGRLDRRGLRPLSSGNDGPAFVPKARLTAAKWPGWPRRPGGVAVLAHPYSLGLEGPTSWPGQWASWPGRLRRHRGDLRALLAAAAPGLWSTSPDRFGLVPTGGSDYHGTIKPDLAVGTGTRRPEGRPTGCSANWRPAAGGRLIRGRSPADDRSVGHRGQARRAASGQATPPAAGRPRRRSEVDEVPDDDAVPACRPEHPEGDRRPRPPGRRARGSGVGADHHPRGCFGEQLVVVGHPGDPDPDAGADGQLGECDTQAATGHVVHAVDEHRRPPATADATWAATNPTRRRCPARSSGGRVPLRCPLRSTAQRDPASDGGPRRPRRCRRRRRAAPGRRPRTRVIPGGRTGQAVDEPERADDRGGVDVDPEALVVEAHVAPDHREAEGEAGLGHAVDGLGQLPHDLGVLGVAEVEAVDHRHAGGPRRRRR